MRSPLQASSVILKALFAQRTFFSIALIFMIAACLQSQMLLNWDVSWLLHAASRLLQGGTYSNNFFDGDPPLILYLSMLPIAISQIFSISIILAEPIFIFSIVGLSLFFCHTFLKLIFNKQLASLLLITIAAVLLIAPSGQLGQREHLMMILVLPYSLLIVLRKRNIPVNSYLAFFIGLFAAAGLLIKPFFFMAFILLELYLLSQKKMASFFRVEFFTILAASLIYTLSTFLFYPDFFHTLLPLMFRLYYGGFVDFPLSSIMTNPQLIFCFFTLAALFLLFKKNQDRDFILIMSLTLIAFIYSYLAQRFSVYYHILPALGLAIVLLTWMCYQFYTTPFSTTKTGIFSVYLAISLFILPFPQLVALIHHDMSDKTKSRLLSKDIIKLVDPYPAPVPTYFISSTYMPYPLVDYVKVETPSRFAISWWLPGLVKKEKLSNNMKEKKWVEETKYFFIDIVATEIEKMHPLFVFVSPTSGFNKIPFDYIAYYKQNPHFSHVWEKYQYTGKIDRFSVYKKSR